jgi:glycosyltransferase involved in cell wall biosynthesis
MATDPTDLSVVMPVFNEAAGISAVVTAWTTTLDRLVGSYELRLYNDGSTDETQDVLEALARMRPRVHVIQQPNRGHGPTVLRGYREAVGTWVFQTDSDDEIPAEMFERLWSRREGQDAIFGVRDGRRAPRLRRLMSAGAAFAVRRYFGRGPTDVNVPFRLIRRTVLSELLTGVPDGLFAPNVALSGLVATRNVRFIEIPVLTQERPTGASSLAGAGKLAAVAARVVRETRDIASRERRRHT